MYVYIYIMYVYTLQTSTQDFLKSTSLTKRKTSTAGVETTRQRRAKAMSGQDDPFVMEQMARLSGLK